MEKNPNKTHSNAKPRLDILENSTRKVVLQLLNKDQEELRTPQLKDQRRSRLYIDPSSVIVKLWDSLFIIIFYFIELQISFSLAFGPTFFQEELQIGSIYLPIYLCMLFLLTIDTFFCFFKGYYAFGKGKVIDDKKKVSLNHLKTQFFYDLIIIILYIIPLVYQDLDLNFLQLITAALLWIKKFKYQKQVQVFLQYRPYFRAAFTLTIVTLDVLMIGNYGACLFIGIDKLLFNHSYYGTGQSSPWYWLTTNTAYPYNLMSGPWTYAYIYAQQFSTGTLSTLAPGPFGKNPIEIFYSIIVMIFFVVLASYVTQVLIQIMYTYTQRRIFHEDNIISFDNFMILKQVGKDIRNRVYNFFQLIWEVQLKMENKEQEEMIAKLPLYLREQLLQEIGFTKHLYFLHSLPQEQSLRRLLSLRIQPSTVDANTSIFQNQRAQPQRSLYFVKKGMAKIYLPWGQAEEGPFKHREIVLNLTNIQGVLGTYQFITNKSYSFCCRSIDLCLLQTLSWSSFLEVLSDLQIKEEFYQLRYRLLVEQEVSLINKLCVVCLQPHMEDNCPQLYPHQRILKQFQYFSPNRTNLRRKIQRKSLNCKKQRSQQQTSQISGVFKMFSGINLGQLIIDIQKLQKKSIEDIEEIRPFDKYFSEYNLPVSISF